MKFAVIALIVVSLLQAFLLYRAEPRQATPAVVTPVPRLPAAPAGPQPDGTASDQLRGELEAIKRQLAAARAAVPELAPTRINPPAPDDRTTQALVPVAERFESQIKDDSWHDAAEDQLIDSLFALESDDYQLYHTDCRQSICRMEIALENPSAATADELAALAPWPAYTRLQIDADAVPVRAVLYVAREGFDFHGAQIVEETPEP